MYIPPYSRNKERMRQEPIPLVPRAVDRDLESLDLEFSDGRNLEEQILACMLLSAVIYLKWPIRR